MTISTDIHHYNETVIAENKTLTKLFSNIFYVVLLILISILIIFAWIYNSTVDINQKNIKVGIYSFFSTLIILSINNTIINKNAKSLYETSNKPSYYHDVMNPNIIKSSEFGTDETRNIFNIE